jgi:hypothetical protein
MMSEKITDATSKDLGPEDPEIPEKVFLAHADMREIFWLRLPLILKLWWRNCRRSGSSRDGDRRDKKDNRLMIIILFKLLTISAILRTFTRAYHAPTIIIYFTLLTPSPSVTLSPL